MGPEPLAAAEQCLRDVFGLASFRPWQRDAIAQLLPAGGQALVVAPTGGGKSLTYQLPAVLLGGTTIVISPLIALMEDQVAALERRGIAATYLSASLSSDELRARERALAARQVRLVFVAPERLANPYALELLASLRPALVAVDEAHCISQWGHDFRPDYARLGEILRALAPERRLACTATATPRVRAEILERLGMRGAPTILHGFARPELALEVLWLERRAERDSALVAALRDSLGPPAAPRGAALVYAGTRKEAERLGGLVAGLGYRSAVYHAGASPEDRAALSRAFAGRTLDVVVATVAFGMGIDRPDVRLVVHAQAPGSLEAYYQEVGRAGRDGQPARGLLLASAGDFGLRRRLIERSWLPLTERPDPAEVERQWALFLELARFMEAGSCRMDQLLRYFGDEAELLGGCGVCDVCRALADPHAGEALGCHDETTVRIALSGVARAKGRLGLTAIAELLAGKPSARLTRLGLTEVSTFGRLAERPMPWIVAVLRRAIAAGLVRIDGGEFPTLELTSRGLTVMRGERASELLLPPHEPAVPARPRRPGRPRAGGREPAPGGLLTADDLDAEARARFERLRQCRAELARAAAVPAYVVCADRTLLELAATRPRDTAALAGVFGLGPVKIARYGEALLGALRE